MIDDRRTVYPMVAIRRQWGAILRLLQASLILLLGVWLTGCSLLVATPGVAVKDVNLRSMDSSGMEIEITLAVTNPNSFALKPLSFDYEVTALSLPLAKGSGREAIEFTAGATTDLRLPVRVSYADLWEILKRNPDPDKIPYQLKGSLEVDTPLGPMALPAQHNGTFVIPQKYRPGAILRRLADFLQEDSL